MMFNVNYDNQLNLNLEGVVRIRSVNGQTYDVIFFIYKMSTYCYLNLKQRHNISIIFETVNIYRVLSILIFQYKFK